MHKEIIVKEPSQFEFSGKYKGYLAIMIFLGLLGFVFGLKIDAQRTWQAYLMGFFLYTSVSLVSLLFLALFHLSSAHWSVNIRRMFEAFTAFIPYAALFVVGIVFVGGPELFKWLQPEVVAQDALLQHKAPYLNKVFFIIRMILFFAGWVFFSKKIVGNSLKQDETGQESLITKVIPYSVGFIAFYALSYSFLSVDLIMSLEPHWFSTIFGIYLFGGSAQAMFAGVILLILFLHKKGLFNGMVSMDHVHDLGKFLLGFTIFWAYIAFSQYMLIWYANMPEETIFFLHRSVGSWAWVSISLIVFKFILPFFLLLPRWAKRTPVYLATVCVLIILTQVLDLYWLIYPNFDEHHVKFSWYEISMLLFFTGVFLYAVFNFLGKNKLIPIKDPRIKKSAGHTVTY